MSTAGRATSPLSCFKSGSRFSSAILRSWAPGTVPTHTAMAAAFAPVMEGLRERGYGRSELSMPHVERLSATAALTSGVAVRYSADGQKLERVGVSYVVHKADEDRWTIAVTVVHDADKAVRPE